MELQTIGNPSLMETIALVGKLKSQIYNYCASLWISSEEKALRWFSGRKKGSSCYANLYCLSHLPTFSLHVSTRSPDFAVYVCQKKAEQKEKPMKVNAILFCAGTLRRINGNKTVWGLFALAVMAGTRVRLVLKAVHYPTRSWQLKSDYGGLSGAGAQSTWPTNRPEEASLENWLPHFHSRLIPKVTQSGAVPFKHRSFKLES